MIMFCFVFLIFDISVCNDRMINLFQPFITSIFWWKQNLICKILCNINFFLTFYTLKHRSILIFQKHFRPRLIKSPEEKYTRLWGCVTRSWNLILLWRMMWDLSGSQLKGQAAIGVQVRFYWFFKRKVLKHSDKLQWFIMFMHVPYNINSLFSIKHSLCNINFSPAPCE